MAEATARASRTSVAGASAWSRPAHWLRVVAFAAALPQSAGAEAVDRPWCRTTSDHFELVTDLRESRSAALLVALDRFRTAAYALLPGQPATPPPVPRLLVFKRARDFAAAFDFPNIGGFMQPSLDRSLLAFGPDRRGRHLSAFAFHEYTHFLLRSRALRGLPIWYEEGLATYLANMTIDSDGTVTLGRGPHALLAHLLRGDDAPVTRLLSERYRLDWQRADLANVYALAWGLVRFLHHAPRPDGGRYAERLRPMLAAIDAGAPSAQALASEVGVAPALLPGLLRAYYEGREARTVFRFRLEDYRPPAVRRDCLGRRERALLLADALAPHRPERARRLYESVLRERPDDVAALLGRSRVVEDPAQAMRDAVSAHALAPADAAVHVQLARRHLAAAAQCDSAPPDAPTRPCETHQEAALTHYRQALAEDQARADAAYGLGVLELLRKRPQAAARHLAAAYRRAPWSPRISYYLGEALRQQGDAGRAAPFLRKTAAWHPDQAWRDRANRSLDAMADAADPASGRQAATSPPAARE